MPPNSAVEGSARTRRQCGYWAFPYMSWLEDDEDDEDDFMSSDELSDMVDDFGSEDGTVSEEEYEDMYDPTDVDDYG